ncbi:hypothetical protein [Kitasatospora sp. NPDC050543]|uniref:hypothetical protein n=1 Tax=Kitasatospora sp. NPDC050543 TaxID=3364054 RepID=UPI003787BD04
MDTTTVRATPAARTHASPPARPAAKPRWSSPRVECHQTGAEVTAYAGKAAPWQER